MHRFHAKRVKLCPLFSYILLPVDHMEDRYLKEENSVH